MSVLANKPGYSEAAALEVLIRTINATLNESNDQYEATKDDRYLDDTFSIVIGGKSIDFLLGGPQTQALYNFVVSIAEENGYEVNLDNMTVSE